MSNYFLASIFANFFKVGISVFYYHGLGKGHETFRQRLAFFWGRIPRSRNNATTIYHFTDFYETKTYLQTETVLINSAYFVFQWAESIFDEHFSLTSLSETTYISHIHVWNECTFVCMIEFTNLLLYFFKRSWVSMSIG